jgi:hypothetical protein
VAEVFEHLRPRDPHDIEHVKILVRHDLDGSGIRTGDGPAVSRSGGGPSAPPSSPRTPRSR